MMPTTVATVVYLVAGILFILSLRGLSTQATAPRGNWLGFIYDDPLRIRARFCPLHMATARCTNAQGRNVRPRLPIPSSDGQLFTCAFT